MPFCGRFSCAGIVAVLAASMIAAVSPASAGGLGEKVYADSFGNLVVHSPAGFKRIVVGRGYLSGSETRYGARGGPKVVYLEEAPDGRVYLRERKSCRHGALLRGRGYMYGLPDGVLPVPTACP